MFAVKGIYDGEFITAEDPVPVAGKYAVAITFLYPVEKQQSENVEENIIKFREKHNKNSLAEHLSKNPADGKNLGFNVQEVIDRNESEANKQIRYGLEKNAWAMHISDNGAKWKA